MDAGVQSHSNAFDTSNGSVYMLLDYIQWEYLQLSFVGQILVGGATAEFPSLHHAFFVGDILIKRDCRLLQNLAPNVRIVNMFGEFLSLVYEYISI